MSAPANTGRYPAWLTHPAFEPAHAAVLDAQGNIATRATPIRFGPVLVQNEDQEAEHVSRGYVPSEAPKPDAFTMITAGDGKPYVHEDYPQWTSNGLLVQDEQDHRARCPEDFGGKKARRKKVAEPDMTKDKWEWLLHENPEGLKEDEDGIVRLHAKDGVVHEVPDFAE